MLLTCFFSLSTASIYISDSLVEFDDIQDLDVEVDVPEGGYRSAEEATRLALSGPLVVDLSPPPKPADWTLASLPDDLKRRNVDENDSSSVTSSSSSTSTLASTTTSGGLAVATTASAYPLPTPFDIGFSSNITGNCAQFMSSMLSNATFQQCLPFSLLLQNSNSFFQTTKSLVRVTQLLDYTCAANFTQCSSVLSAFASNITSTSACSIDLANENPLIEQALLGLLAYKPLYQASCLHNPSTGAYCYADAITNASNTADAYIYFLPLNISLVGGSQPTCDTCLKETMQIFEADTSDRKSALFSDYVGAAMQVNVNCGPGFVNSSLAPAASGASPSFSSGPNPSNVGVIALFVLVASWLL